MTRPSSHTLASLLHVKLQRSSSLGICWVRRELCSRGAASGEEKWIQASPSCWLHPETARGRETAFSSSLESSYLNSGQKVLLEFWGVGARGRDDGNKPHFVSLFTPAAWMDGGELHSHCYWVPLSELPSSDPPKINCTCPVRLGFLWSAIPSPLYFFLASQM